MHPIDAVGRPLAAILLAGWCGWHAVGFLRWDRAQAQLRAHRRAMRALRRAHHAATPEQ